MPQDFMGALLAAEWRGEGDRDWSMVTYVRSTHCASDTAALCSIDSSSAEAGFIGLLILQEHLCTGGWRSTITVVAVH